MVLRISLGITTRPRSSIRRTIPVAFIYLSPFAENYDVIICKEKENILYSRQSTGLQPSSQALKGLYPLCRCRYFIAQYVRPHFHWHIVRIYALFLHNAWSHISGVHFTYLSICFNELDVEGDPIVQSEGHLRTSKNTTKNLVNKNPRVLKGELKSSKITQQLKVNH